MVPDSRALIAATSASFIGDFGRSGTGVEISPKNEASLAEIRARNAGRANWWRVGCNFPRISLESWADHWALMVPDFTILIAARNASLFGNIRANRYRGGRGPLNEAFLSAIGPKSDGPEIGGSIAISPGSLGDHGPIVGN